MLVLPIFSLVVTKLADDARVATVWTGQQMCQFPCVTSAVLSEQLTVSVYTKLSVSWRIFLLIWISWPPFMRLLTHMSHSRNEF